MTTNRNTELNSRDYFKKIIAPNGKLWYSIGIILVRLEQPLNASLSISVTPSEIFKIVYAGSIRDVNNVDEILSMADIYKEKGINNIKFIIFLVI